MNEQRFTGKSELYKKFRPSYPKELVDYLYSIGFDEGSIIADIGAGTGIFSRLMLERGSKVYCVEPNEDMRNASINDLSEFENFVSVNGNDKNTGLQDNSVDYITVAQAAHWFDKQAFISECKRIIKPGGKLVIVWNGRDYEYEVVLKDYEIRNKYAIGDKKGLSSPVSTSPSIAYDFYENGNCEHKIFRNDLRFDKDSYIGRNLSASYAPKKETEPEKHFEFINKLADLFDEYSINGILNYPHYTESYIGIICSE
jgi:SAM-dependent methyltransferase